MIHRIRELVWVKLRRATAENEPPPPLLEPNAPLQAPPPLDLAAVGSQIEAFLDHLQGAATIRDPTRLASKLRAAQRALAIDAKAADALDPSAKLRLGEQLLDRLESLLTAHRELLVHPSKGKENDAAREIRKLIDAAAERLAALPLARLSEDPRRLLVTRPVHDAWALERRILGRHRRPDGPLPNTAAATLESEVVRRLADALSNPFRAEQIEMLERELEARPRDERDTAATHLSEALRQIATRLLPHEPPAELVRYLVPQRLLDLDAPHLALLLASDHVEQLHQRRVVDELVSRLFSHTYVFTAPARASTIRVRGIAADRIDSLALVLRHHRVPDDLKRSVAQRITAELHLLVQECSTVQARIDELPGGQRNSALASLQAIEAARRAITALL